MAGPLPLPGRGPPPPPPGGGPVLGPGPEMSAGVLGMTLGAGVLYLIRRRNRT
jgi:hypothetical protein